MTMRRRDVAKLAAVLGLGGAVPARAQSRGESLRLLTEGWPNTFDPIGLGANRYAIGLHWNAYDRLLRFATGRRADGTLAEDPTRIEGELAEHWDVSEDGREITLVLRDGARFHDGTPVTTEDVKWSLDRVVSIPVGRAQFGTGSMTDPAQFSVLDSRTVRITTPRADRFTLPNLALTFPVIVNSRLARAHATAADPWATDWLRGNVAGGGAFRLEQHTPGQRLLLARNDDWRCGPPPGFRRVLWQVSPTAASRRAALERGDADWVQDLLPQDAAALAAAGRLQVPDGAAPGAFHFIGMSAAHPPFDDPRVRQAVAWALPYRAMFEAALFGRGRPLFGTAEAADALRFPQPLGYATDPARARALLAEAGLASGFATRFSFDQTRATVGGPVALLVQEALGRIGIRVTIETVPGGQLGTLLERRQVPFFFEGSAAFLAAPDYFFRVFYHGATRWNFGAYDNPEFAALVERTRYAAEGAAYDADVVRMIALARRDVPIIPLWQPASDNGLQPGITGHVERFHRMPELRTLARG
jgi:peptide/nickel transport system substrate-binding protein